MIDDYIQLTDMVYHTLDKEDNTYIEFISASQFSCAIVEHVGQNSKDIFLLKTWRQTPALDKKLKSSGTLTSGNRFISSSLRFDKASKDSVLRTEGS